LRNGSTDESLLFHLRSALFGGLRSIISPQTSFIDGRGYVRAFDFEQRTRLTLPEKARSMSLLKTDLKIV
jgi:hypothetical protein